MILTTTSQLTPPAGMVLHVAGEVDTYASDELREQLRGAAVPSGGAVVVDLAGVTFMSCTALSTLAEAQSRLGTRLHLGDRSRAVARLLDLTGLASYFPAMVGIGSGAVPVREAGTRTWTFSRTDVERARGLLMAVHGCDADQAWRMIALAAARSGVPVGELVELLIRPPPAANALLSSDAAVAALSVLMREPADGAPGDGDADAQEPDGGAPHPTRLTNT